MEICINLPPGWGCSQTGCTEYLTCEELPTSQGEVRMNRTLKSFWFPLTSVFVLPWYSPLYLEITLYEVNHSTFQNCFCVFSTADVRETVNSCFEVFSNRAFDSMKLKWFLFTLLTGDSLTSWVLFSLELWFIFFKWSSFRSLPVPGAHW